VQAGSGARIVALSSIAGSLAPTELLDALGAHGGQTAGLRSLLIAARRVLGPASSARHVLDVQVLPLARALGLDVTVTSTSAQSVLATIHAGGRCLASLSVAGWGGDLRRLRDHAARITADGSPRWWLGANGALLRIMDVSRAYTRRSIDLDLERLEEDDRALNVMRRLLEPGDPPALPALEALIAASEQHRSAVGRSLQAGVDDALGRLVSGFSRSRRKAKPGAGRVGESEGRSPSEIEDALTVVYRILFLLFAEARGLVPQWHPVYRDSYTIESLRPMAEARGTAGGLWQSLQAIARLAHRGCSAGTLRVVPFNGRLFAPSAAPLAESFELDDAIARDVLLALTTRPGAQRRERISYVDLGVEQLGAVYERVLDYQPAAGRQAPPRRKSTGTFYTPRSMTEYLVRRTLAPLVRGRSPEGVLSLRVVDPAMGSGAFLVAACRYLADAYEEALIAEQTVTRADISPADRAAFRRVVAQRCLYGVDLNPTAVQLARLSLWLCTLAADRPLTFLDHHLRTGNSLAGARPEDVMRQPPGRGRRRPCLTLPLFDAGELSAGVAAAVERRREMALVPDDSAAVVRRKERDIGVLAGPDGPLGQWRAIADAWCATWFWPDGEEGPTPRTWPAFSASLRGHPDLPERVRARWTATAAGVARAERFFHWELEFPEVFFDDRGERLAVPGFDAVIGNPPWAAARELTAFSRESGCFALQGDGHANLYQLFAERMLRLTAGGGRLGMLMPSGLLADHGCAQLRRYLFERSEVDAIFGFDNRDALFPIHRGLRFTLLTATVGGSTADLRTRFGVRSATALDDVPDVGEVPEAVRVPISLIRRFGGDGLAVPELAHERDRGILARVVAVIPPLGSAEGWGARFGRELNATDDRPHFGATGLPILEGKLIEPFHAHVEDSVQFIERDIAMRLLAHRARIDRPRLGYREVASSTNRLTLIAAVIPAGAVTTHTIFCMREPRHEDVHWYLCGIFNSFVANYLVRLRGGTHVPASVIHQLPVPAPPKESESFMTIARLSRMAVQDARARAEINARAAIAYGLDEDDVIHVLNTFPLVPEVERRAALHQFRRVRDGL
jgi:hypothetical protein